MKRYRAMNLFGILGLVLAGIVVFTSNQIEEFYRNNPVLAQDGYYLMPSFFLFFCFMLFTMNELIGFV